jgi:hypothetical protein
MRSFVNPDSLISKRVAASNPELNQFCIRLLPASIMYGGIDRPVAEIASMIVLDFRFEGLSKKIYKSYQL